MNNNSLPVVITKKGGPLQKQKLSFTARTAINSQKKIDQQNRSDDTRLSHRYQFYNLEMLICESQYKKHRTNMKQQITDYQTLVQEYRKQKERTCGRIFMTEPSQSRFSNRMEDTTSPDAKGGHYQARSCNQSPDAISSVRRKTKPILASSVTKELDDLERLKEKHLKEYAESIMDMQKLEKQTGMTLRVRVPYRSYPPFTAATPNCSVLTSLRNKIRYSESDLKRTQQKYRNLASKYERSRTTAVESVEEEDAMDDKHKELLKDTFKLFCEKKSREIASREPNGLEDKPLTQLPQVTGTMQRRKSVRFDLEKMKQDGIVSLPMLNLLNQKQYVEIVENPFLTDEIPVQTRSRLLLEAKKDDTMHVWLGFNTREEMEKALKESPNKIKQIPAALLAILEDAGDNEEDLDRQEFSDSGSSGDDEDDPRFKIFDEDKVKGRKRKVKLTATHTT